MTVLPKLLILLLGSAALHQGDGTLLSWKPAWKRWPMIEFGSPSARSLQGPSSFGLSLWDDFDYELWPSSPNSLTRSPNQQRACQGGWVKMDEKSGAERKLETEERQLQQREDQLRKEWQDLQNRKQSHKMSEENRKQEERQRILKAQQEQQRILKKQQQQQQRERLLQQQREQEERHRQQQEARRVERQKEEQRRQREEQERRRQEEMIRAREERKRLEEQQQRQERIRREEMERQRLLEERELRSRRQQEELERQRRTEEQTRQRQRDQKENMRHKSRTPPKSDLGKLTIPEGYNLEDLSIETVGNQAFIKGHHICGCREKCYDREFERRLSLPKNVDTRTISASLYPGGTMTFQGVKYRHALQPVNTDVTVEGVGLPQRTASDDEVSCKKLNRLKPSGFKLKKMNARTGEVFDDVQVLEDVYPKFESEIDDDGLTIEVEDY